MVNQVGGGFGRWERCVLGGARWATWACRSQLGGAASLPGRWEILGGWMEQRLVWEIFLGQTIS
jgi:hypothetical protein